MRFWTPSLLVLALVAAAGSCLADPAAPAAPAVERHAGPLPLATTELESISAGQAMTVVNTVQALNAVNTGNSITAGSVRSGDINFSQQALSNFSGIGNFVVNTGANNNLQGSLSVTVVAAPAMMR